MTTLKNLYLSLFIAFFFVGNAQDSIAYYHSLINKEANNSVYNNLLAFQYSSVNKDSCFYYANIAYNIAVQNKDTLQIAEALANLGESKTELGQADIVIKNYKEALDLFISQKAWFQISKILNRMGILYNDIADDVQAEKYYKEAIQIQYKHKINNKIEYIFNNLATTLYQQDKYQEALTYLDSALVIYKQTKNKKGISYVYANKSYVYILTKDFKKAKNYLDKANILIKENNDQEKLITAYKLYTILYTKLKQYNTAKSYADSSYQQAQKYGFIDIENSVNQLYYILYKSFKKYDMALRYLENVDNIKDSLKTKEKDRLISEIKVRFDMELNEQKIINLNNINKLNKYKINTQKKWIWILSIGLFILIILLVNILLLRRAKFFADKKLIQKNIEQIHIDTQAFNTTDIIEDTKYSSSKLTDKQKQELTNQINHLFNEEKIYLDPNCSISLLEEHLDTNKTYISQVINERFEYNFKTILKEYRIKEATKLLIDPNNDKLTIEAISQLVGFKSKSVFNNAFKSITGVTPSFFQKEYSK